MASLAVIIVSRTQTLPPTKGGDVLQDQAPCTRAWTTTASSTSH
jgi:hypothetical protein